MGSSNRRPLPGPTTTRRAERSSRRSPDLSCARPVVATDVGRAGDADGYFVLLHGMRSMNLCITHNNRYPSPRPVDKLSLGRLSIVIA